MSVNQNNAQVITTCNQRLTALKKHVKTTKGTMKVNGQLIKPSDFVAAYQKAIDTRTTLIEQRAAYEEALEDRNSADSARVAIDQSLKAWVTNEFGLGSTEAKEFGFSSRKVGEKSAQTKADAVEKSKATRVARGTKGKRQKADIKGTVEVPAGSAAPTTTTTAASPAAAVPASTNGAPTSASSANGATASH